MPQPALQHLVTDWLRRNRFIANLPADWLAACIDFLCTQLGAGLSAAEVDRLSQLVFDQLLHADLDEIGYAFAMENNMQPSGEIKEVAFLAQVRWAMDIGQPFYQQYLLTKNALNENLDIDAEDDEHLADTESNPKCSTKSASKNKRDPNDDECFQPRGPAHRKQRTLFFELSLGNGRVVKALEYVPFNNVTLVQQLLALRPGAKVVLTGPMLFSADTNTLLLEQKNFKAVYGGDVESLLQNNLPAKLFERLLNIDPNSTRALSSATNQIALQSFGTNQNQTTLPNQTPTNQAPSNQLPINQMLSNKLPVNQMSTNQMLPNRLPTNQMPSNRLPTNQIPSSGMPQWTTNHNSTEPAGTIENIDTFNDSPTWSPRDAFHDDDDFEQILAGVRADDVPMADEASWPGSGAASWSASAQPASAETRQGAPKRCDAPADSDNFGEHVPLKQRLLNSSSPARSAPVDNVPSTSRTFVQRPPSDAAKTDVPKCFCDAELNLTRLIEHASKGRSTCEQRCCVCDGASEGDVGRAHRVRGFVDRLVGKLENKRGRGWRLGAVLTDGRSVQPLQLHSHLIARLMGISSADAFAMHQRPADRTLLTTALARLQTRLKEFFGVALVTTPLSVSPELWNIIDLVDLDTSAAGQ